MPWAGVVPSSAVPRTVVLSELTVSIPNTTLQPMQKLTSSSEWVDTKIILDTPDPNYVQTLGKGQGVTGDLTSDDGGKTWVASEINIPAHTF